MERLSSLDAGTLRVEDRGLPMRAAALPYQPNARVLQCWMVAAMRRQRLVNVLVSNLPGPAVPVSPAGASVLEMFQIGVVQGNAPVSVGVLSSPAS